MLARAVVHSAVRALVCPVQDPRGQQPRRAPHPGALCAVRQPQVPHQGKGPGRLGCCDPPAAGLMVQSAPLGLPASELPNEAWCTLAVGGTRPACSAACPGPFARMPQVPSV